MKKRFIILWILILFSSIVNAKILDVRYKVSFGLLGQMGIADARLKTKGNSYTIDIEMKTTGIAKILSHNRKERHRSTGHIRNGIYISDTYRVDKSHGNIKVEKIYYIDHKAKKVVKEYIFF